LSGLAIFQLAADVALAALAALAVDLAVAAAAILGNAADADAAATVSAAAYHAWRHSESSSKVFASFKISLLACLLV
jgi:hypothetical protein